MLLLIAVLATLMPAILGFFVPNSPPDGFVKTPLERMLLRQARDVSTGESDVTAVASESQRTVCAAYRSCVRGSVQTTAGNLLSAFDYGQLATDLANLCASERTNCQLGTCKRFIFTHEFALINLMYDLACGKRAQFEAGTACWQQPFMNRMTVCMWTHQVMSRDAGMTPLLNCLADVPAGLPACSPQDTRLVVNVTNTIAQAMMDYGSD